MASGLPEDDEPDPRQVETVERHLAKQTQARRNAIAKLYGGLPDWLPEPVHFGIEQSLVTLRNARQPFKCIAEFVGQHRKGEIQVPGGAHDVTDFIKAVNYLAHVQWALSLGKERALEELAGSRAAKDYRRSKAGNAAQSAARTAQLPQEHPLRRARSVAERDQVIRRQAENLRAEYPNLKESEIKGKVAVWAGLSKKQAGRILGRE
jgi:hypothetical protein